MGRAIREVGLAAGRGDLVVEDFPFGGRFVNQTDKTFGIEVHIGQGGKTGFDGKDVDIPVGNTELAPLHRHLGQAHQGIEQQILQGRHLRALAANPLHGAGGALGGLFALVAKHGRPPSQYGNRLSLKDLADSRSK